MNGWPVRLSQNKWWRVFWLCWIAGSGIFDVVAHVWWAAIVMAVMLPVIVILWMVIDRQTAR